MSRFALWDLVWERIESAGKPVEGFPRWKYHAGHAGMGIALAAFILVGGAPVAMSCAIGALAIPTMKELKDAWKQGSLKPDLDMIADFNQYQLAWNLWFVDQSLWWPMVFVDLLIFLVYFITLPWSRP